MIRIGIRADLDNSYGIVRGCYGRTCGMLTGTPSTANGTVETPPSRSNICQETSDWHAYFYIIGCGCVKYIRIGFSDRTLERERPWMPPIDSVQK